uniref:Ig-like domain-containing protein n=1 Tax=Neolamprologus brichardi TaxID=32507 RepID=A0A3Q4N9T7_NEOBR
MIAAGETIRTTGKEFTRSTLLKSKLQTLHCNLAYNQQGKLIWFTNARIRVLQERNTLTPFSTYLPRGDVIILLEWRRSDLKSDTYVFFFRNQRPYENYQHKFFKGRVELRDPTMKDGDVSVILKNVSTSDTGTYECEITVRNTEGVVTETKHSVNLTVTTSGETQSSVLLVPVPSSEYLRGFQKEKVGVGAIVNKEVQRSFKDMIVSHYLKINMFKKLRRRTK